ncbi:hypothetical protein [Acrocarpospora sp. B8E8]|uniref:hypothetical protein n=1 Tax=Acrocarpospora sp. B8E8 TaxID=3153572 RepID=UPI00325F44EA
MPPAKTPVPKTTGSAASISVTVGDDVVGVDGVFVPDGPAERWSREESSLVETAARIIAGGAAAATGVREE